MIFMFKKYIIAILLVTTLQVNSQEYKPLIDNINEWHFTTCYFGCLTDVYYTDGDTVVNGVTHKVLDGYHFISRTFLLREEIENRKVYLTLATESDITEYLLYDFTLAEGDEIDMINPISPFPQNAGAFVLDSIRMKELADLNEYRHFYFSPTPTNTISLDESVWVEGVGSLSLINAPGGHPDINDVGSLSCFFKDTELFYSNLDSIDTCEPLHLGLTMPKDILNEVKLISTSESFTIINTDNVIKVTIYGLSGKKINSVFNIHKESSIKLKNSSLSKGVYIIIVNTVNNNKKTFKTVVY